MAFTDTTAALMPKDVLAQTLTSIATIAESPGVTGVDARTLMRAWSERLNSPAVHANEYYKSQPARLREVGQTLDDYFSMYRVLPLWGSTDASGNRLLSWRVMLLPFMGQQELYSKFRLNERGTVQTISLCSIACLMFTVPLGSINDQHDASSGT